MKPQPSDGDNLEGQVKTQVSVLENPNFYVLAWVSGFMPGTYPDVSWHEFALP